MKTYSVTILPDTQTENFTLSLCKCDVCERIHAAQIEWETFTPKTQLQKRMKSSIYKIEKKIKKKIKKETSPVNNI